ncbi:ATP-binding protein [Hypericibacter adhaerens]|uniref:ATP-binding protein Uup n=1 Tax=Hypericibacter adhaerens TaxID=2602016 RepID=A0A5J6N415_9PROT|nr:ATP-binding cassette domain-containing protein [Hypericibacter adhaerens]QEX24581.1 ATP-binding protein [Hypericibacter adhaerens]
MAPPILILRDIHLTFGGTPLLEGAELALSAGERLCLVGRNGSGKSTLLKIAAGLIQPDGGERFLQPGTTLRYLPQEPDLSGFATTLAYVEAGLAPGDDAYRAKYLLEQLGLTGEESPARLSGGEARRAALARALAPEPDILLLDEPTNHLDLPAIEWLEAELKGARSAQILISHDRRFLETLSQATVWLSDGRARRLDKGFAAFESWRDEILEQEEVARHKLDRKIASEMEWLHRGVTARRKRNQGRLRALFELRKQRRTAKAPAGMTAMEASAGELSGQLVVQARKISKSYGDNPIVRDFSTRIQRGDRVGIIGANGAGKTTLLNLLTGQIAPDSGSVKLGVNLQMVTLDQRRDSLDPAATLATTLTGGRGDTVAIGDRKQHVIGYMKEFLFSPEQANTPVGVLSGGERGRLILARALARPSNLLVLDEPTNDLDLETLDLLQEMLADYDGTVLLVSHDRDFLDRVVTSVIVSEGQGRWAEYAGGYSDMVLQRGSGVEAKAIEKPRRAAREETPRAAPAPRRKLSFKEEHALKALPARMEKLQAEIAKLQGLLADPSLYARDRATFDKATAGLHEREAALAEAEHEWLELELKREEIERA